MLHSLQLAPCVASSPGFLLGVVHIGASPLFLHVPSLLFPVLDPLVYVEHESLDCNASYVQQGMLCGTSTWGSIGTSLYSFRKPFPRKQSTADPLGNFHRGSCHKYYTLLLPKARSVVPIHSRIHHRDDHSSGCSGTDAASWSIPERKFVRVPLSTSASEKPSR